MENDTAPEPSLSLSLYLSLLASNHSSPARTPLSPSCLSLIPVHAQHTDTSEKHTARTTLETTTFPEQNYYGKV